MEVEAAPDGTPLRLRLGAVWHDVTPARSPWRLDQHWWRPAPDGPVRRDYYRVVPADAPPLTLYRDRDSGAWFRQDY